MDKSESLNEKIKRVKFNLLNKENGSRSSSDESHYETFPLDMRGSFLVSAQSNVQRESSTCSSQPTGEVSQVNIQVSSQVDSQVNSQVNSQVFSQMSSQMNSPAGSLWSSHLDVNQNTICQNDRNKSSKEHTDFSIDRITSCPATTKPSDDLILVDHVPPPPVEQHNDNSNMSISASSDDSADLDTSNIVLGERLSKSFPSFFNLKTAEVDREPPKAKEDELETVQIPGILENARRTTGDNSNLISRIESLSEDGNQNAVDDEDLFSNIDFEPFADGDSFLDPDSLNQMDQAELNLLFSNSNIDIDLFLANDLLLENELTAPDDEVQVIDQRQNTPKDPMCEDSDVLMKFINLISSENKIDFKATQRIIIDSLKGNTPVFISRYQTEDSKLKGPLVSKVVKDFNDLRRVYHFKNWKKTYAMSKRNRFDQKASELFDQCLSYEKIALVYYLYYQNTKCRPSNSQRSDDSDSLQNDVYVNDDLSLKILNNEQRFDSSLKNKIPNHQNREEVLYERMVKMISHFVSKNEGLIRQLNSIQNDARPTLTVKQTESTLTTVSQKFDKYLGKQLVIQKMSPVEVLELVYGEELKQIKLEFDLSKIKEGAYQTLTRQYRSADARILEDVFEYMWSFYFQTPISAYFRYEMKWKSKKLLENDLQMKLRQMLQREPVDPKITWLGVEPLGTMDSEGIQYAIKHNGMVILNDYFDLKGPKPLGDLFVELHREFGFTVVVIPNTYFFMRVRCMIHDILQSEAMAEVRNQIRVVEPPNDNKLIETMSPQFRVEYHIERLSDPLRQWIAYSNYMTIPSCDYFDLFKPYLSGMLTEQFREMVSLLPVDVNVEGVSMLQYVNGLNRTLAEEIVNYRKNSPFMNRRQIRRVKGMTDEIYRQAVGFLYIDLRTLRNKSNVDQETLVGLYDVYDSTIIHPDMYKHADLMLKIFGIEKRDLGTPEVISRCQNILAKVGIEAILKHLKVEDESINLMSIKVIFNALLKPLNYDFRITYTI